MKESGMKWEQRRRLLFFPITYRKPRKFAVSLSHKLEQGPRPSLSSNIFRCGYIFDRDDTWRRSRGLRGSSTRWWLSFGEYSHVSRISLLSFTVRFAISEERALPRIFHPRDRKHYLLERRRRNNIKNVNIKFILARDSEVQRTQCDFSHCCNFFII